MKNKSFILIFILAAKVFAAPAPKKEIRIAAVFDLGNKKHIVQESLQGIDLAVEDLKHEGYKIRLKRYDSTNESTNISKAMESAIAWHPNFIIAETDSSRAFIAGEIAEKNHYVMFTPTATSPRVTENRKFVFRLDITGDYESKALASFAIKDLQGKTAAIIYDATQMYSSDVAKLLADQFQVAGGNVLFSESILPDDGIFKNAFNKLKAASADILFLPVYEELAAKFINAGVTAAGFGATTLIGGNGWATAEIFDNIVLTKSKELKAYWIQHADCTGTDVVQKEFAVRFEKKYKMELRTQGGLLSYDAVRVGVKAVELANNTTNQDQLRDRVAHMPAWVGMTGSIDFNGKQDPAKKVFIVGLKGGKVAFCKGT